MTDNPGFMLLKDFKEDKISFPCLAAVKINGIRAKFINGELITRDGYVLPGLKKIKEPLSDFDHEFDGELVLPGYDLDTAAAFIRSGSNSENTIYYIFDIPTFEETKINRYYLLREIGDIIRSEQNIQVIKHYTIFTLIDLYEFYLQNIRNGEEGVITYNYYSEYENDRSYNWMRMVPKTNLDLEVVDMEEGRGNRVNALGNIKVKHNKRIVSVKAGFRMKLQKIEEKSLKSIDKEIYFQNKSIITDSNIEEIDPIVLHVRSVIWNNKQAFMGRKAIINYKYITPKDSLKQPKFVGWRLEKCPKSISKK